MYEERERDYRINAREELQRRFIIQHLDLRFQLVSDTRRSMTDLLSKLYSQKKKSIVKNPYTKNGKKERKEKKREQKNTRNEALLSKMLTQ